MPPWCGAFLPFAPYQPTPRKVSASSEGVAHLPRPVRVNEGPRRDCPHSQAGLTRWDPQWLTPGGIAEVPAGTRALVNGNDDIPAGTLIRSLRIPAGSELVFADQAATFRVTDVQVAGALRLGSPTCRLQQRIEFVFDTDENVAEADVRQAIFERHGLGIVVEPGGVLEVFGKLYQPTWTRLDETAAAGATRIKLAEPVDWEPGQRIVLVTSAQRDFPYADQNEVRGIAALEDRRTLVLDAPLEHLHYGGREYQVEVGLLTRSIVFRTADSVRAAAPTFGGHIFVHAAEARVSGAELIWLGQQNFLGRYPLHLHHAGDVAGRSYFADNSIWRSNWRCAVIHRTHNAVVTRNVAFDVYGHCYYIEDGVEVGNELSFNLAARVKIMGPLDEASLREMNPPNQWGFVQYQTSGLANPADRAAAGFYITNGRNRIVGNAASGGFAGYSFPTLPEAIGGNEGGRAPVSYAINHFNGNSAHTAGYFWTDVGCVYVGGLFQSVDDNGTPRLRYNSGRVVLWEHLRHQDDVFANTKTFLCSVGITHWGNQPRVINLESWDNELMAKVFGSASVQSAIVAGATGNTANLDNQLLTGYRRGFQFYDTDTQTILRDVMFRDFRWSPYAGAKRSDNNCALFSMTHSDEFTPQRMNATAELHFRDVDEAQRICHDDTGTLSSRNFNLFDADGSATRLPADGLNSRSRMVGAGYTDIWRTSPDCIRNDAWGLWMCPPRDPHNVAAINTRPNQGVRVAMYDLQGRVLGENWYSTSSDFEEAQVTGPSGIGWHHAFPGDLPGQFEIWVLQVPVSSFVLFSFSLPPGASCSINAAGWQASPNLPSLLASSGAVYTTDRQTCFIRIPPTDIGAFEAAGLSIPNQTWRGNPTPTTYFTVNTGCGGSCGSVTSTIPSMQ